MPLHWPRLPVCASCWDCHKLPRLLDVNPLPCGAVWGCPRWEFPWGRTLGCCTAKDLLVFEGRTVFTGVLISSVKCTTRLLVLRSLCLLVAPLSSCWSRAQYCKSRVFQKKAAPKRQLIVPWAAGLVPQLLPCWAAMPSHSSAWASFLGGHDCPSCQRRKCGALELLQACVWGQMRGFGWLQIIFLRA